MNTARALQELDLRPGATEEEIRDAYRKLAATWHPDKYQNDPAKLHEAELRIKNINAAFEKLQTNGFRTERKKRKANDGSKTASSTSTEDGKNSDQATRGPATQSSTTPFYKSPYLRFTSWLICVFFAFILGFMNGSEVDKSNGDHEKKLDTSQNTIASLKNKIVTLEEQAKHLQATNEQLKNKVNVLVDPTYIIEQTKQFSQKNRLELAATWREELDYKSKMELFEETIPPGLDDLSEDVAGLYYSAIGPTRQKRILNNVKRNPPTLNTPQNIRELEELVSEISDAKDKAWLPFYTEMLGVRSEACRNAVEKLNKLLVNIVGQKDWENLVLQERDKIIEEQNELQELRELNTNVAKKGSVNRVKEEFENIKNSDWINADKSKEAAERVYMDTLKVAAKAYKRNLDEVKILTMQVGDLAESNRIDEQIKKIKLEIERLEQWPKLKKTTWDMWPDGGRVIRRDFWSDGRVFDTGEMEKAVDPRYTRACWISWIDGDTKKIQFVPKKGHFLHTYILSKDGKSIEGKNTVGTLVHGKRVGEPVFEKRKPVIGGYSNAH